MHEELSQIKNSIKREWTIRGSGGGKITIDHEAKKMHVHGYCYTFGTADHRYAIECLKKNPAYEGYEFDYEYEEEFNCSVKYKAEKDAYAAKQADMAKEEKAAGGTGRISHD